MSKESKTYKDIFREQKHREMSAEEVIDFNGKYPEIKDMDKYEEWLHSKPTASQLKDKEDNEASKRVEESKLREIGNNESIKRDEQMELVGAPIEFQNLYVELKRLSDIIHNVSAYGDVVQQEKVLKLKDKTIEIVNKMLAIPFKGYSMEFVPVTKFVSTANPEHSIEKGTDDKWRLNGYDKYFDIILDKDGNPVKATCKRTLYRLFNDPKEIIEEHPITFITQEAIDTKKNEAIKNKPVPKPVVKTVHPDWECHKCSALNYHELLSCRICNTPRQKK